MKSLNLKFIRTDLAYSYNINKLKCIYEKDNVKIYSSKNNYSLIRFNLINNTLKDIVKGELNNFINKLKKRKKVLVVGLGNDNFVADSIGPKTLKNIKVNSYLKMMNIKLHGMNVSAIEPSVLGETGIETKKIIKSICDSIKPDFVILIDAFICNEINILEKAIIINDEGLSPGSGIMGNNSKINKNILKVPVIVIGVPCAIETSINNKNYILTSSNIDKYAQDISLTISSALNEIFYE